MLKLIGQMEGFGIPGAVPTTHHNRADLRHGPHMHHPGGPKHAEDIGTADTVAEGDSDGERQLRLYADRTISVDPETKQLTKPRKMTIHDAIYTLAPTNENNTARYLAFICHGLGLPPETPMTKALELKA